MLIELQQTFENKVAKEEITHNIEHFLSFATLFFAVLNNQTFDLGDFPHFCLKVFIVDCCRYVKCGKELKERKIYAIPREYSF